MSETSTLFKVKTDEKPKWLELVVQQVNSLHYGTVEIIIHDSRVIQIEKTERVRLEKTASPGSA